MTVATSLELRSPAFGNGERIPTRHTGEGEDISPALEWSGAPDGTRELALICDDPDAPLPYGWVHWVGFKIPPETTAIPEGGGSRFVEGINDFGRIGYGGPLPPPGHGTHHYYFWLYALSKQVDASPGISKAELLQKIAGNVISQARIVGTYSR